MARKLGIRSGLAVALVGAPRGWSIVGVPDGVRVRRGRPAAEVDVVVAFFGCMADLEAQAAELSYAVAADGALWVAWPRRAAGHESDITDESVRAAVLPLGLVDTKVAALDENWSSLKFVWRRRLRSAVVSRRRRG
jgi:hypothetical protein